MTPAAQSSTATSEKASSSNSQQPATGGTNEFEPPLACIRRILKNSLPKSTNVGKDASLAFSRACGIFCIYLATCANDFARESKRSTITANDILAAIKELDFDEFTPQLEHFLQEHRKDEKRKKDAKKEKETTSKGKAKEAGEEEPKGNHELDDDDDEDVEEDAKLSALDTSAEYGDDDDDARHDGEEGGNMDEDEDEGAVTDEAEDVEEE